MAQRGAQFCFIFAVLRTLFSCSKMSLFYLKTCPPPPRGNPCAWVKPGRFGSFFVLCFLALGGYCRQMLCLPGFGTHANTQNLPHFHAFPASIQEQCPPKCLFFLANAKLPNRPGFALLPVTPEAPLDLSSCLPSPYAPKCQRRPIFSKWIMAC